VTEDRWADYADRERTVIVVLRVDDPAQARLLVRDMADEPGAALLTPSQENEVHARLVGYADGTLGVES